ncbi:MAG TPA: WD40 repeat domain-containing protein [Burkholderiaceae bacterium]|nr:WD40 repeat domain-containing protein [Burkholderiaceae bacterium]HQR72453.1 WD40 repeat domain-containing protein [Burkholderiaceae bacterium]
MSLMRGATVVTFITACALAGCASTPGRDRPLDPVMATAPCADGRTMVVSTDTSEVALFEVAPLGFRALLTQEGAKTKPLADTILKSPPIACSPDSRLVIAAGVSGDMIGWDIDPASVRFRVPIATGVTGVAFFPDGRSFMTAGPTARQWSTETGAAIGEFLPPGNAAATSVAISPDGGLVLVGTSSGEIVEFDAASARAVRTLKGHAAPVTALTFSPDGTAFASAAGRFDPRIWQRADGAPLPRRLTEVVGAQASLEQAGRETQALVVFAWLLGAAAGFRNVGAPTLGAPPLQSMSPMLEQAAKEVPRLCGTTIAYSPDGRFLAATANLSLLSGEFHVLLADLTRAEGRVISGIAGCSVAFTRDSKLLVTGGYGAPQLWNAETGQRIAGTN